MRFVSRLFSCAAAAVAAAFLFTAAAPTPLPSPAHSPAASTTEAQAHPALWTVHGSKAIIYLLGSIHVLPPKLQWRTPQINAALNAADTFVFEIPMDASQKADIQEFVKANGYLPEGTALPSLLPSEARKDYAAALSLTHVPPDKLTPMRPWLALLVLEAGMVNQQHFSVDSGVDRQVYAIALKQKGVSFRAFETPEQQLRLLMPEDQSLEVQEFDAALKDLLNESTSIGDLIHAWARADVTKLNELMNSGFKDNPRAEKTLFEDRNHAWVAQLETMLNQRHVFFVTAGAGHFAGQKGIPALLRAEGYRVDGP
ncbi:MAG TPA: TraB/GumN family protein [Rhizomicrobium sp.]|jgi:hypothetical protein|nr:TraB/GumN family protein [Rhizomicrobium sp.]